jgi:hypothetical protein
VQLEERNLAASLGTPYREYRRRVPMFLPRPGFGLRPSADNSGAEVS